MSSQPVVKTVNIFSNLIHTASALLLLIGFAGCDGASTANEEESLVDPPSVFGNFTDAVEIYVDGDEVVLRSNGVPNHSSPYFNQSDGRYEAYDGGNSNFVLNPNRIAEQNLTFRIPLNPTEAGVKSATPLGAIGISLNGVPFYNQYAGPNRPLTNEIDSFDQYNGHPQQFGGYHYHIEPLFLTLAAGKEAFIGFLLDGFPVYGPEENGGKVVNGNLDAYHGHFGATADYPEGIYHYHVTDADPYINGAGFFGKAGTVSQ